MKLYIVLSINFNSTVEFHKSQNKIRKKVMEEFKTKDIVPLNEQPKYCPLLTIHNFH